MSACLPSATHVARATPWLHAPLAGYAAYALGAAVWVGVWAAAGYLAGDHIRAIQAELHRYQWYVVATAALVVIGYGGWRIVRGRRAAARR